ncbi:MAG TPA: VOC family protein [Lysobacter sp.]|jgi:lactoylglutathione lyase|nr:VOC family protein [Lysobacter sp.]
MKLLLNIDVPEIATAEAFYTAALGLRPGRRFGADGLELLGLEVPLYLLAKTEGSIGAGEATRTYARHWTPLHCDLAVDDLDAALARAVAAGAVQEGATREAKWGRLVQIADPYGHGWCLLQFHGRGYDEIATSS